MRKICSIDDCDKPTAGLGYCSKHYQRFRTHGDPNYRSVRPVGPSHHNWLPPEAVTYDQAHKRVRAARGVAGGRPCATNCGAAASQWSYDHADPDELHHPRGYAYSLDPQHYRRLCVSCHKRLDMSRRPSRKRTPEEARARRLQWYAENREAILEAQRVRRRARRRAKRAELLREAA